MQRRWSMLCLTLAWLAARAVLGLGPGAAPALAGPPTATLQALETMKRMDAILAPQRQAQIYAQYIGKIPVIMDPWQGIWSYKGKPFNKLTPEELKGVSDFPWIALRLPLSRLYPSGAKRP